jgi:hypothetical protein
MQWRQFKLSYLPAPSDTSVLNILTLLGAPHMRPVKYVDRLNEKYRSLGFPTYEWTIHRDAPISPLQKPLKEFCVSILTTRAISRT